MNRTNNTSSALAGKKRATLGKISLGLAVGLGTCYLAFDSVSIPDVWEAMQNAPWWAHGLFFILLIAQFILRSLRWRLQVMGIEKPPLSLGKAFGINAGAFAATFLFPVRLGEFVRPLLCKRAGITSASTALAHSLVERVVDGLLTTAVFGSVILFFPAQNLPPWVAKSAGGGLLLFGGIAVAIVLGVKRESQTKTILNNLLSKLHPGLGHRVTELFGHFIIGIRSLGSWQTRCGYILLSILFWGVNGFGCWLLIQSLSPNFGIVGGYFTVCFLVIAVMVPAPPGNVGNFHYFGKLALVLLGLRPETALAAIILIHAWTVIALILWLLLFVMLGELSLKHEPADGLSTKSAGT